MKTYHHAEIMNAVLKMTGLTAAELSRRTGITGPAISDIRHNRKPISPNSAKAIITAFPELEFRYEGLLGIDPYLTQKEHGVSYASAHTRIALKVALDALKEVTAKIEAAIDFLG